MSYRENYENWLNSPALSQEEKAELEAIRVDEKEIESRFFDQLAFGTAGLRGTMGVGLYRMNVHVIRHATQAFAQVILEEGPEAAARGVAVCFDCRNNSGLFAREAACVMAGNGIPVRLFQALRPTPELSFAVREYGCIAGINVTASHNPKEYNGYKVYWQDGAQLPPQHACHPGARRCCRPRSRGGRRDRDRGRRPCRAGCCRGRDNQGRRARSRRRDGNGRGEHLRPGRDPRGSR